MLTDNITLEVKEEIFNMQVAESFSQEPTLLQDKECFSWE